MELAHYIRSLKTIGKNGKPLISGARKTGFLGKNILFETACKSTFNHLKKNHQ